MARPKKVTADTTTAGIDKLFGGAPEKTRRTRGPNKAVTTRRKSKPLPQVVTLAGKQYLVSGTHVAQL